MSNIVPSFHLGQILHTYIKKHRLSQAALARDINKSPRAIAMYLKRPSLQVNTLMELCIGLRYNFFSDLAAMLPESLPPETGTEARQEMDALRERIKELEMEKRTLENALRLVGKG